MGLVLVMPIRDASCGPPSDSANIATRLETGIGRIAIDPVQT